MKCRRVARAINAVGLYVPGGTAILPSTALMLAVVSASYRLREEGYLSQPCLDLPVLN